MTFLAADNNPIKVMGVAFYGLLSNRNTVACTDQKQESYLDPSRKNEFDGHWVYP